MIFFQEEKNFFICFLDKYQKASILKIRNLTNNIIFFIYLKQIFFFCIYKETNLLIPISFSKFEEKLRDLELGMYE